MPARTRDWLIERARKGGVWSNQDQIDLIDSLYGKRDQVKDGLSQISTQIISIIKDSSSIKQINESLNVISNTINQIQADLAKALTPIIPIESFNFDDGLWQADYTEELWAGTPKLSFVSILNTHGYNKLHWFEQIFNQSSGHRAGNCSIWNSPKNMQAPIKLYEGGILDYSSPGRYLFDDPLDISVYPYVVFVSDGALGSSADGLCYVKQSKQSQTEFGYAPLNQFVDSAYLGIHEGGQNIEYLSIPSIPEANNPKYFMNQWVKIGVSE